MYRVLHVQICTNYTNMMNYCLTITMEKNTDQRLLQKSSIWILKIKVMFSIISLLFIYLHKFIEDGASKSFLMYSVYL